MSTANILIVDDELVMRESLAGWLERDGHYVRTATSGEQALEIFKEKPFNIILLDIKMEGMSGLEVLRRIKESETQTAVVMITAFGSIATAIEAMKNGAQDYLLKPFDPDELGLLIEKVMEMQAQNRENQYLREQVKDRSRFESIIGQSAPMQEIFDLIGSVAPSDATVLITGETGTGKGLAAKAIHTRSHRCDGPFVTVNCGAIPEHLMESELFGHQRGAFTDAKETKRGRLELAHGGTIFLDEIGEIGMRMQIDLLRVMEDRVFYRVGGTQPIEADFRVIAATNRDLEAAIRDGIFREDLYYRLNVFSMTMPGLRDRKEDIPLLAEHFLYLYTREINKSVDKISREAMDELMLYGWPGNVRELRNAIERAVVVCKGHMIELENLPIVCQAPGRPGAGATLREMEEAHIAEVLGQQDWNIARSAKVLGIDRSTLYSKINRYGIRKPR